MYIGYVDESGYVGYIKDKDQPIQVMACILPSAYNLPRTTDEFADNIQILRDNNIPLSELKAEEIYRGKGAWHNVEGRRRHEIFDRYFNWLVNRKHKIILSIIDNNRFFDLKTSNNQIANYLGYPYVAGALHIALAAQKLNKNKGKSKGRIILIFDEQRDFQNKVQELIARPPKFTDDFYGYQPKDKHRLNQIIDTAYFTKSHYSYLVQVADTVAFVSRLYLQLKKYGMQESYQGELKRIQRWFKIIRKIAFSLNNIYPKGSAKILKFYRDITLNNICELL